MESLFFDKKNKFMHIYESIYLKFVLLWFDMAFYFISNQLQHL